MSYTITTAEIARLAMARDVQCAYALKAEAAPPMHNRSLANVAILNGTLRETVLPIGRLAAWSRLLRRPQDFELGVEFDERTIHFYAGASKLSLRLHSDHTPREWLGPAINLVAPATGGAFEVELREGIGTDLKTLRKQAANLRKQALYARKLAKSKRAEHLALVALQHNTSNHVEHLAVLSKGIEAAYVFACDCRDALRLFRRSIKSLDILPPWLLFEPDTARVCFDTFNSMRADIQDARQAFDTYKPPVRRSKWGGDPRPARGPKWLKLSESVNRAESNLRDWLSQRFKEYLKFIKLPSTLICGNWYLREVRQYSQARIALRKWPALKSELAQSYIETRDARLQLEKP